MYISMQYKFCVDGEWHHVEEQPYVSGNYGVVNTVLVPAEPNTMVFTASIPEIPGNMEVDDVILRPVRDSFILGQYADFLLVHEICKSYPFIS